MEIKDLAGLSQPLTKLIEVTASGIGAVAKPVLTMANAKADAYAIKTISQATRESHELLKIDYKSNAISIGLDEKQIADRASERVNYQEIKRQLNTENILQIAVQDLSKEETVSSEAVDEDWTTRFFTIAQDVSNEEMQFIWGKILAGEVRKPKSYSLRTLELLKNISREEAATFQKVAKLSVFSGLSFAFILDDAELLENYSIQFPDLLKLEEVGLIQRNLSWISRQAPNSQNQSKITFTHGNSYLNITKLESSPEISFGINKFTTVGAELLSLIQIDADLNYVNKLASLLLRDDITVHYGMYNPENMKIVQTLYSSKSQTTND